MSNWSAGEATPCAVKIYFNFPNLQGQDYHKYNTRGKLKFRLPSCKTNWGKNRSSYHFKNEFNNLNFSINTNTTFSDFKYQLWNS